MFYQDKDNELEFRVLIGDKYYGMDSLTDVHIRRPLFDKFDVGLACCAEMTVQYRFDMDPPRGAKLIPYCRRKNSNDEWYQLGVFYIDLRKEKVDKKILLCYDSMLRADISFMRDGEDVGEWPRSMKDIVNEIVNRMGISLDSRTYINPQYTVDYPNEDSMRTILMYVAAAHGGNWIVTRDDKLLLVPLFGSMPPETHYLVTEYGYAIVFGEDRILI